MPVKCGCGYSDDRGKTWKDSAYIDRDGCRFAKAVALIRAVIADLPDSYDCQGERIMLRSTAKAEAFLAKLAEGGEG